MKQKNKYQLDSEAEINLLRKNILNINNDIKHTSIKFNKQMKFSPEFENEFKNLYTHYSDLQNKIDYFFSAIEKFNFQNHLHINKLKLKNL